MDQRVDMHGDYPEGQAAPRSGIYSITNKVNGKVYVGSGRDLVTRFAMHRRELRLGKHHSVKLQRAWAKYGEGQFEFHVLLRCSIGNLLLYEQRAIRSFDAVENGYNVLPNAYTTRGYKHSEETKQKMSARHKGKKLSPEHCRKIADRVRGVPMSAEVRAKISATMKGRKLVPSAVAALSSRVWKESSRAKVRSALMGHPVSMETRNKIRERVLAYHQRIAVTEHG